MIVRVVYDVGERAMNATEIRGVLDAHDSLVRDCVEERLTFAEFLGAYGDFPRGCAEEREALRLFPKRAAFHRHVAGVGRGYIVSQ